MKRITLKEYQAIPEDYRGIWKTERWDIPNWSEIREQYIGKRTMLSYNEKTGGTCLLIEGLSFEIVNS